MAAGVFVVYLAVADVLVYLTATDVLVYLVTADGIIIIIIDIEFANLLNVQLLLSSLFLKVRLKWCPSLPIIIL